VLVIEDLFCWVRWWLARSLSSVSSVGFCCGFERDVIACAWFEVVAVVVWTVVFVGRCTCSGADGNSGGIGGSVFGT
jgi:hypothetical protein